MRTLFLPACLIVLIGGLPIHATERARPNILFISVDDMNCDSVGVFGCRLPDTTPHIDKLAREGLRFQYAHVQVGNCMPSRNVMFSGRYPHNNRVEGFYPVRDKDYPTLTNLMRAGGYFTGIRGKVSHSTPYQPYPWDSVLDTIDGKKAHIKDAGSYYESTRQGIAQSEAAGKPFCLLINVSDPHKPFYATGKKGEVVEDPYKPSRIFTADEVPVPGFLFDHPDVRRELAQYYSSVRRADDCVGATLRALDESGKADETVVVFLSDHGMPLPFAKTALYHHSTRTPWIVRWPGVTARDAVDKRHMISAVDLLPTLLDIAAIDHPAGLDGRSFLPLLHGDTQPGRDMVFKVYNENSGGTRQPMRSVQSRRFGYIFNPWADGKRIVRTATQGTITYRTMKQLAETDEALAARLKLFNHRVREEFYDYENDPDALHNLIDDPEYAEEIDRHRTALRQLMEESKDHALPAFVQRDTEDAVQTYMKQMESQSVLRRRNRVPARTQKKRYFTLAKPAVSEGGKEITATIRHRLPADLGEQKIHVTLKNGTPPKRVDRQVISIIGTGTLKVTFDVTDRELSGPVTVAAFLGRDYASNLQHTSSQSVPIK